MKVISEGDRYTTNRFGEVVVLNYTNAKNILVRFEDGFETITDAHRLRSGQVVNKMMPSVYGVGYIGTGRPTTVSGVAVEQYVRWKSMMTRCYCSKFHKRYPTYANCVVVDEWHNFQTFADWYDDTKPDGYFELDKDDLSTNEYGPNTCTWVTSQENKAIMWGTKGDVFVMIKGQLTERVTNKSAFAKMIGTSPNSVSRAVNRGGTVKGWKCKEVIKYESD